MAPAANGWGNGWGNIGLQSQNFRRDPEVSRKHGDLVVRPGFTDYLALSLKSIHCSDFTVKGLIFLGVVCMLKHLMMQKWVQREKDVNVTHVDRNQGNLKFCFGIPWVPENKKHLIENGES